MEKEYIHSFLRLVSTHRITVLSDKYTTETGWCQVYINSDIWRSPHTYKCIWR